MRVVTEAGHLLGSVATLRPIIWLIISVGVALVAAAGVVSARRRPAPNRPPSRGHEAIMVFGCPGGLTAAAAVGFGVALPFGIAVLAPWSVLLCWWAWRLRASGGRDDPDIDPDHGGGGGGGGGRDDPGGPGDLPAGGIDWDQFEREFRAYAERQRLVEV